MCKCVKQSNVYDVYDSGPRLVLELLCENNIIVDYSTSVKGSLWGTV